MPVSTHIPVLVKEVVAGFNLKSGDNVLDATLGGGGHGAAILEATAPNGRLLGIDWDPKAVELAKKRLRKYQNRIILRTGNYTEIKRFSYESGFTPINAILLDLGLSSDQLADRSRGFSFQSQGPLDMRFSDQGELTAGIIVNTWSENDLAHILREYGEERHATRIAQHIVASRRSAPINSVEELVAVVLRGAGARGGSRIHPATRIFQALRIATNQELRNLSQVLPAAVDLLAVGGRVAVIAFHSLEDRIVKQWFKAEARGCICPPELPLCRCDHKARLKLITKKAVVAAPPELKANPRSRSAKLRIAQKIA